MLWPSELALHASLDGGICNIVRRINVQSSDATLAVDHGLGKIQIAEDGTDEGHNIIEGAVATSLMSID